MQTNINPQRGVPMLSLAVCVWTTLIMLLNNQHVQCQLNHNKSIHLNLRQEATPPSEAYKFHGHCSLE
jgi:hypothetical protein